MTKKPTLHMIGCFHTINDERWSACAFSQKTLRWAKMMQPYGYDVVEYSNGESKSDAKTKVSMIPEDLLLKMLDNPDKTHFHGSKATIGTPWWRMFDEKLTANLKDRVQPGDIICHPFGHAHEALTGIFPNNPHVETGIGYPTLMRNSFKIFESYCWMAYHQGKHIHRDQEGWMQWAGEPKPTEISVPGMSGETKQLLLNRGHAPAIGRNGSFYEWVVPNYFDLDDWLPRGSTEAATGPYADCLLFFGRICSEKGMDVIKALAEVLDEKIVVAGQGDIIPWKHKNIEYIGPVHGKARSDLLRNARAMLMPTQFIEPFGGSGVESQLVGTPLIGPDYGAFGETIEHGKTGYRCHTLGDFLEATKLSSTLSRTYIADRACSLYSLEACGTKYDRIFQQIGDLRPIAGQQATGWFNLTGRL